MKILIIEDEQALRRPIRIYLENRNFEVDEAEDGLLGLENAKVNNYDCIILDLNLPGLDGIALAKQLRKSGNTTPIIMATARSQIYNKLEGFDNGADDYITKPFNLDELVARIKALIKRNSINKENVLKIEKFEVFPDRNTVQDLETKNEVILSNKEMAMLEYMLRNKGRIISSEEFLEHIWSTDVDSFTQTVKTHIKTLRKKIDPKKKLIISIKGKGYQIR